MPIALRNKADLDLLIVEIERPEWEPAVFQRVLSLIDVSAKQEEIRLLAKTVLLRGIRELQKAPDYPNCNLHGKSSALLEAAIFAMNKMKEHGTEYKSLQAVLRKIGLLNMFVLRDVSPQNDYLSYLKIGLALADFALPYIKGRKGKQKDPSRLEMSEIAQALLDDVIRHIKAGKIAIRPPDALSEDETARAQFDLAYEDSHVDVVGLLRILNYCSEELIEIVFKEIEEHDELLFGDIIAELRADCTTEDGRAMRFGRLMKSDYVRYSVDLKQNAAEALAALGL